MSLAFCWDCSALGGVGMAALMLAQRTGCKIIASAGTPAKREALAKMEGVIGVVDSRCAWPANLTQPMTQLSTANDKAQLGPQLQATSFLLALESKFCVCCGTKLG
jgi:Zn-dependent alcohol dehydrogenase